MAIADVYNYRQIDERVFTSGIPTAEQFGGLKDEGFEAVISLLPDESPNALAGEADLVKEQGLEFHHIPVDWEDPTEEDYHAFVDAFESVDGKKVLIHCAANYRASAFYSLYAMQNLGWSEIEADDLIGSLWDPMANPPWDQFIEEMREAE